MGIAHDSRARRNSLLAALGAQDRAELAPRLERIRLEQGDVLFDRDEESRHVWFPEGCVVSLTVTMLGGGTSEAATIGREGVVGAMAALGGHRAISRGLVSVPGAALRLPAAALRARFEASPGMRRLCMCHADALLAQMLQLSACGALHPVEARLCRALLQLEDRTPADEALPLTQDFLAEMLGVHRTTVTQAARSLQRAGVIAYRRGRVTVVDRALLERASCECYATIRERYDRLLPESGA